MLQCSLLSQHKGIRRSTKEKHVETLQTSDSHECLTKRELKWPTEFIQCICCQFVDFLHVLSHVPVCPVVLNTVWPDFVYENQVQPSCLKQMKCSFLPASNLKPNVICSILQLHFLADMRPPSSAGPAPKGWTSVSRPGLEDGDQRSRALFDDSMVCSKDSRSAAGEPMQFSWMGACSRGSRRGAHHLSKKGECSPARVRVGTLLFLCVDNLLNHPRPPGGEHKGPCLVVATLAPFGIKHTRRNVQRKLFRSGNGVCFRREVCREKSVDFFYFFKENKPLEMNFWREIVYAGNLPRRRKKKPS